VDRAGDDLLAHPGLAQDQDRDGALGGAFAQALHEPHGARGPHEVGEGDPGALRALGQALHLRRQLAHLQGVADGDDDALRRGRLDEEVLRPRLHGADHGLHPARGGEHDHRRRQPLGAHGLERLHPRHPRHDEVEDHHVGGHPAREPRQGCVAGIRLADGEALALQHRLDQAALRGIVVDDENGLGHGDAFAFLGGWATS
jgi:hypothetical protein